MDIEEKEEREFETLLSERRYKELKTYIKNIANSLNDNKEIISILDKQTESIKEFSSELKSLPTPEINIHQNEVVAAIERMEKRLLESNEELKALIIANSQKEWVHTPIRNYGVIEKIVSVPKKVIYNA